MPTSVPASPGRSETLWATVTMSHQQLLGLAETAGAVTLVPAAGAGTILEFVDVMCVFRCVAAYTNGGDMNIYYGTDTSYPLGANIRDDVLQASVSTVAFSSLRQSSVLDLPASVSVNQPLVLWNASGTAFSAGSPQNRVMLYTSYRVWPSGL